VTVLQRRFSARWAYDRKLLGQAGRRESALSGSFGWIQAASLPRSKRTSNWRGLRIVVPRRFELLL
jgi:hypothetical protein